MKFYWLMLFATLSAFSQVGIGTNSPTASLDVDGNLRIRTVPLHGSSSVPKDSILVADNLGNVQRVSSKTIVTSHLQSFVRGGYLSTSDQSLTLSSGSVKLLFNYEEFDENSEYDITDQTFTAKADGIYAISVQIKLTSGVGVATNLGVAIAKNGTVIAKKGFANIVIGINVTPPVRDVYTLVKLVAGDKITFITYSNLINIGLNASKDETFFTIHQVR